jgi:hypothetical protein
MCYEVREVIAREELKMAEGECTRRLVGKRVCEYHESGSSAVAWYHRSGTNSRFHGRVGRRSLSLIMGLAVTLEFGRMAIATEGRPRRASSGAHQGSRHGMGTSQGVSTDSNSRSLYHPISAESVDRLVEKIAD